MDLIGKILMMAIFALAAYALPPHIDGHVESVFQRAVVSPPKTPNNTCTAKFTNDVKEIYNKTVLETEECYKSAEAALDKFDNEVLNKTVVKVNAISKTIQITLANCSAKSTNVDTLKCYNEIFDTTLANLNNLTSLAQVAASSVNDVEYLTEINTKLCVNGILFSNKINSSIAANDLQKCLGQTSIGILSKIDSFMPELNSKTLN